jgi:S-adenosylmethionine decarboxylase
MPGKLAAGRAPARLPVPAASPAAVPVPKQLWTVDAALTPGSPVTEIAELTAAAGAAVRAGGGTVLDTSHVVFPNGAVTLVLILAESHLAIHTWPEESLIAVDLFSCGAIAGERVAAELITTLRLADPQVRRMERGAGPGGRPPGTPR